MPYQQNKEQLVQSYQERTVELQEKSRKIETMSDTEKHELSVEIETTLFDLKKDMEILDVTTDVSEKSQLVNFETQLTTMKNSLAVTSDTEITLEEVNLEDKSRYGKALDWIKEHPGWTALGVGTVGLGFLAYRWHKKRKAKEEAEKKQVSNTKNSSGQAPIVINT